jgi:dihydrofolate reductase
MKAIIARNNKGYIGLNNGLPWGNKAKADFKHFKEHTMGGTLLVGYNTHLTLPPLKGRTIVLDERDKFMIEGIDWCIGGKKTYEKYAPYLTELHISHINDNTVGDVEWPDFSGVPADCKIFHYFFELG